MEFLPYSKAKNKEDPRYCLTTPGLFIIFPFNGWDKKRIESKKDTPKNLTIQGDCQ